MNSIIVVQLIIMFYIYKVNGAITCVDCFNKPTLYARNGPNTSTFSCCDNPTGPCYNNPMTCAFSTTSGQPFFCSKGNGLLNYLGCPTTFSANCLKNCTFLIQAVYQINNLIGIGLFHPNGTVAPCNTTNCKWE